MDCRSNCAACCIYPSITSVIPEMPNVKPAGVRCIQLADDLPAVNDSFTYKNFIFEPVAVNDRTVTQVKVTITNAEELYEQVHS